MQSFGFLLQSVIMFETVVFELNVFFAIKLISIRQVEKGKGEKTYKRDFLVRAIVSRDFISILHPGGFDAGVPGGL